MLHCRPETAARAASCKPARYRPAGPSRTASRSTPHDPRSSAQRQFAHLGPPLHTPDRVVAPPSSSTRPGAPGSAQALPGYDHPEQIVVALPFGHRRSLSPSTTPCRTSHPVHLLRLRPERQSVPPGLQLRTPDRVAQGRCRSPFSLTLDLQLQCSSRQSQVLR